MDPKTCTACRETKPLDDFPRKNGKHGAQCKLCRNKYYRDLYHNNPERRAHIIELVKANKQKNHQSARRRKYNLTADEFNDLVRSNSGLCHLCNKRPGVAIDHDHDTGVVRGHLCAGCNSALGVLGDSIEGLERAIAYLRKTSL